MGRAAYREGQAFVRRLHAVAGGPGLRKHAVARALGELSPEAVARIFGDVLALERAGDEAAACVLGAMMAALEDPHLGPELSRPLAQLPPAALADEVLGLLVSGSARKTFDEGAAARADARNFPETLGLLKTKARTARDPDSLARIALASNPAVVRNLLLNPYLTEPMVVRLAARRPARGEPLVEVWRSRWGARHTVRRALVLNPYLPPAVGVKVVPLLLRTDWDEISADGGLHSSVRAEARALLAARRPGDTAHTVPEAHPGDDAEG